VASTSKPSIQHVLIGGFTADADGRALGIRALRNTARGSGKLDLDEQTPLPLRSPTYLIGHPAGPWVYEVSETSPAQVHGIGVGDDGELTLLGSLATGGDGACHLCLTRDGRFLIVANYSSGSVATFAVREDGTLSERVDLVEFSGSGPDPERQEGSHAHQAVVDGDQLLVCDLGADVVRRITIEPEDGVLGETLDPIELPAGSGPRHLVVVDDFLVVACELSAELWFARRTEDGWEHVRTVPTSTSGAALVQPSAIVAAGNRLFVANRGADTIAVFDIEPGSEWLIRITEFDCGGSWPRDLTLREGLLWVSNQHSDTVSVFEISPLPPDGPVTQLSSPSPACVLLLPPEQEEGR
jgi:6-phosphogluconolactonase (cycloisomerase 2 family)